MTQSFMSRASIIFWGKHFQCISRPFRDFFLWFSHNTYITHFFFISPKLYYRRRQWHPTPVLLPGKSHGRRSVEGCSPWGRWGRTWLSDFTFTCHISLSCIEEGNGNPLQCSCLESPRDRGAWWASVYGVTESQTRLKWLSRTLSNTVHKNKLKMD